MIPVKSQERRVKSRTPSPTRRSISGSRPSTLDPRPAFTLVELLITILIIGILAALVVGIATVASETARESESRHIVGRLHTLLTQQYETYKTRRVRVRQAIIDGVNQDASLNTPSKKGRALATARLYALRELMMMELPDRWSDVLLIDVPTNPAVGVSGGVVSYARYPYYNDVSGGGASSYGRTQLADVYLRRYAAIATRTNTLSGQTNTRDEILSNQGAECLYMIVTLACGEGEARGLIGEKSIGDTDGDGALEFLDGWGHPIDFLRWAPGFDSQLQINANLLGKPSQSAWLAAAGADHDPFDVFRVDAPAFRLVPLIFSPGRDEESGIRPIQRLSYQGYQGLTLTQLQQQQTNSAATVPAKWPAILPYVPITDPADNTQVFQGNDIGDKTSIDNVHNHLMGQR